MTPRIERIEVYPLRLPLKEAFSIARGTVALPETGAPHVYVRVTSSDGIEGWGEARPSHRWSYETLESVVTTLRGYLAPAVQGLPIYDLEAVHARMNTDIAPGITLGQPIAKSALDMALHDLIGRTLGLSLPELWGTRQRTAVELSYMVSATTPEEAFKKVSAARTAGYRGVKVKIGLHPTRDPEILRAAKEAAGSLVVWADANQAYAPTDALRLARHCERLGIDVLEQPLPAHASTALQQLAAAVDIPIALDESVASPPDLLELLRRGPLDAVVIKVSKSGGLRNARRMIELCRDAGVALLGSGLTESRLGFAAGAALYAAYGIGWPVDLNGPQFLSDDPLPSSPAEIGPCYELPRGPGIGLAPDPAKLARFREDDLAYVAG
jgi:muconate cycloisomerase